VIPFFVAVRTERPGRRPGRVEVAVMALAVSHRTRAAAEAAACAAVPGQPWRVVEAPDVRLAALLGHRPAA
jgi:hypothetical protein